TEIRASQAKHFQHELFYLIKADFPRPPAFELPGPLIGKQRRPKAEIRTTVEVPHLTTYLNGTTLLVEKLPEGLCQPLYRLANFGWIKRCPDRIDLTAFIRSHQATAKITERRNLLSCNGVGQGLP